MINYYDFQGTFPVSRGYTFYFLTGKNFGFTLGISWKISRAEYFFHVHSLRVIRKCSWVLFFHWHIFGFFSRVQSFFPGEKETRILGSYSFDFLFDFSVLSQKYIWKCALQNLKKSMEFLQKIKFKIRPFWSKTMPKEVLSRYCFNRSKYPPPASLIFNFLKFKIITFSNFWI